MNKRILLSLAQMGGHEKEFIKDAFETNWVAPLGPNVDGFEADLKSYLGADMHVVALTSGTAAIHLALLQLGVEPGDEVICQSFTFAASANPIAYLGATPVFVDSEPETWNLSPELLKVAIEDRIDKTGQAPKAIIPVHLYGMPAKMDEILSVANEYGIPVLEDAAEALGSEYRNKMCGTLGEMNCLSFNGNKIITTSGGGALVCRTLQEAKRTKFYATQSRDKAPHYQHSEIGYNYRMSNISAGIGRGQMLVVDKLVCRRREINDLYRVLLKDMPGISFHTNPSEDFKSNYWLTCIVVDAEVTGFNREDLRIRMENENIETRPLWKPLHLQPVFSDCPHYINGVSESLFDDGLCLPSGSSLTDEDIKRVAGVIVAMYK